MARVVLKHLDKTFPNGFHAVWDLNLEIADGELVVLAGPSGCGKTTTLRMIAGLEQPSRGLVYIGDRLVNDVAPCNRDVAMVFQGYALYPHMSVFQNMAFGLKMRRTPRAEIEKRVSECAEILSIESLLDRRPDELSGGERQRVALGRSIVREPKVFLFDEPLSNLDAKLRAEMRAEIAALHQRLKTTIIYVTHDQVEAMTLGDRIALINDGSIQQTGPPLDIYRRPANEFVASFIGSPKMNFFGGQVREGVFTLDTRPVLHAFGAGQYFVGGHVLSQEEYEARLSQPAEANLELHEIPVGKAIEDGPATLGVRPQDFLTGTNGHPFATVTVDVVEHFGHESFAHFTLTGFKHIARLPADTQVQGGDRLAISIQPAAIHLFSASGRRMN